nr:MAG TPA: hypothetical protein [Inoviridae sp.]
MSVYLPAITIIRSTSQPIPQAPPVRSQITPVPILPVKNLCTPKPPRKNVIKIAPALLINNYLISLIF